MRRIPSSILMKSAAIGLLLVSFAKAADAAEDYGGCRAFASQAETDILHLRALGCSSGDLTPASDFIKLCRQNPDYKQYIGERINNAKLICDANQQKRASSRSGAIECAKFGQEMVALVERGRGLNCPFAKLALWDKSAGEFAKRCREEPGYAYTNKGNFQTNLDKCAKAAGANAGAENGGRRVTAINGTDVYSRSDGKGQVICSMSSGDSGGLIALKIGQNNWVHVSNISGDCNGQSGWVWNGGDLKLN